MLYRLNSLDNFLHEIRQLQKYPEITSDATRLKFQNLNYHSLQSPSISDNRLLHGFCNSMRKILILEKEEINIKNIHREIETYIEPHYYIKIDQINSKIHNYLSKKINLATNFVVDMGEENTNVKSFLNDFYFGFIEHSSRDAQLRFTIVNALYFGQGTEMARIMMVELNKLLQKYGELMIEGLNKSKDKNLG